MVLQGQVHVAETGLFEKEYLEWIKQPLARRTQGHFKTFWMENFKDYELLQPLTSKEVGYGANMANTTPEETNPTYDLEEAMDTLAYTAMSSNNQLEMLVNMKAKLSIQLKQALDTIKKVTKDNGRLLKIIKRSMDMGYMQGTALGQQIQTPPGTITQTSPSNQWEKYDPNGY